MFEVKETGREFGRLPDESGSVFEQRQGQFLCTLDPETLAEFQKVSKKLEAVEARMQEVDFQGLYDAHLKLRVEKHRLYALLNRVPRF